MKDWVVPVGLMVLAAIIQLVAAFANGRVKRLEQAVDTINRHHSDEEDDTQEWRGQIDIRLALIEQHLHLTPQVRTRKRREIP